jgi:hypothetical protein
MRREELCGEKRYRKRSGMSDIYIDISLCLESLKIQVRLTLNMRRDEV